MQKLVFKSLLLCCGLSLVVSCSKEKLTSQADRSANSSSFDFRTDKLFNETFKQTKKTKFSQEKMDNEKINNIYKIEDEEVRRIAYSMLSAEEKLFYWYQLTALKIEKYEFSEDQREILLSLREATINETMFSNVELQEVFRVEYLPLIAQQLEEAGISGDQIDKIFVSGSSTDIRTPGTGGAKVKCVCNTTSLFGCSNCKSGNCNETSSGCGFVFWFRCDGDCANLAPIPNRNDSK